MTEALSILQKYQRDSGFSAHQPFTGKLNGEQADGWIRMEDGKALLQVRIGERTVDVFAAKYIHSPVLFADRILFSAPAEDGCWPLHEARLDACGQVSVRRVGNAPGRVQSIRSETREDATWLVYERRQGKKVRIFAARDANGSLIADIPITGGSFNAYDPHVASRPDGTACVVYSAFIQGNYRICLQELTSDGLLSGEPRRIGANSGSSFWPSICPDEDHTLWICWSSYSSVREFEDSYLQHHAFKARRRLFTNLPEITVIQYDGTAFFVPDVKNKENWNVYRIACTLGGKYPVIVRTPDRQVRLLFVRYSTTDQREKPELCGTTLSEEGWSEPEPLVKPLLHEQVPSVSVNAEGVRVAAGRDYRTRREFLDKKNSVELVSLRWNDSEPSKPLPAGRIPFVISPLPLPSLEMEDYPVLEGVGSRLIWGQTHCHSNLSVCQRRDDQSIDFNFRFFQDVMHSDFGCVTDHCYNQWPLEQYISHKMADYYYFPGQFIAFPAYEWTGSKAYQEGGPFGHVNCLFLEEEGEGVLPYYSPLDEHCAGSTLKKLWDVYKGRKVVTIPHHTSDNSHPYNWAFFDEAAIPVVEVFQDSRGQHEQPGAWGSAPFNKSLNEQTWVVGAYRKGLRMGMISSGDHTGIARAGVEVDALTRTALYKGLMSRRTYASTEIGVDIRFTANGHAVGSVLTNTGAAFRLEIAAPVGIAEIALVRNGDLVKSIKPGASQETVEWETTAADNEFWYCKVLLVDGEVLWTSPIWLESREGKG